MYLYFSRTHLAFLYMTLSPMIILVVLLYSCIGYEPLTKGDYVYPGWANAIGWSIAMIGICSVFVIAIAQIIHQVLIKRKVETTSNILFTEILLITLCYNNMEEHFILYIIIMITCSSDFYLVSEI